MALYPPYVIIVVLKWNWNKINVSQFMICDTSLKCGRSRECHRTTSLTGCCFPEQDLWNHLVDRNVIRESWHCAKIEDIFELVSIPEKLLHVRNIVKTGLMV